ncbi:MAG: ABC transporter permease [Bacteroidetes bacterium]|nr:ABC transporter permease [Bacteroidota bacterium]
MKEKKENWDLVIQPKQSVFSVDLQSIWRYRDLLMLFVRRDFVSVYKQTVLGPIWFFIQPILTTITYLIVFYFIAEIKTDGLPPILFYMSGIVLWNYFSECLTKTSDTFTANATIFGKVYFPRLIVPISVVMSNLIRLGIQLILLVLFWIYFYVDGAQIHIQITIALLPLLLLLMAGHGLAFGIIISSLTTKYRDLKFLVQFGVQLLMYASPIVYPLSKVPEKYHWILLLNPMTSIIETFKYSFLGVGVFNPIHLCLNFAFLLFTLSIGLLLFNRVEKSFMDTV